MNKTYIAIGAIVAAVAVIFGAMGAHWLKAHISMADLQNFETGVRYQMYHALGMLLLGLIQPRFTGILLHLAFHFFWIGTLLFSGSIYVLSTANFSGINVGWIGPITPIGGVLLILGWVLIAYTAISQFKED
jgi:uncharacterized membrane protein YgdD (TMEM256/DUF423 family)